MHVVFKSKRRRARPMWAPLTVLATLVVGGLVMSCMYGPYPAQDEGGSESADEGNTDCGPAQATVVYVVDGDTVELESGARVRYLMVDTPETSGTPECFGTEAEAYNQMLVEGQEVELRYDEECRDPFGRLLAYVEVNGVEVNTRLVERGYACVLHIPPNGVDRLAEFNNLESIAAQQGQGMWGACGDPCD